MTWNNGTSPNYRDLLDQLIEVATSRHMDTVAVSAGGINYTVGEVLDIDPTGSTSTHVAQIEVVAAPGGIISQARIYRGGAYTVDPTNTTPNTSTSTGFDRDGAATTPGTGATFNISFAATGWSVNRRTQEALSAVPAAAGTGYNVGDQLTLVLSPGGVQGDGGADAVFQVATTTGGPGTGVATVTLVTAGNYEETPTNPAATTTGGGGSGCTLTVTYQDAVLQDEQLCILQGTAAGAVDPLVGIKLFQGQNATQTATTYNWALFGMTSYSQSLAFQDQVNLSPGVLASGAMVTTNVASIVVLKDPDGEPDMEWWVSVTPRRILGFVKVQSATTTYYMQFHLGLLNPLGTTAEFQYPLWVCGMTNRITGWYRDVTGNLSGLTELSGRTGSGIGYVWYPEGASWLSTINADVSSDTDPIPSPTTSTDNQGTYPGFRGTAAQGTPDTIVAATSGFDWYQIIWDETASALEVYATSGTEHPIIPVVLLRTDVGAAPDVFVKLGEVEGLGWASAAEGQSSEDYIREDPDRWMLAQNGNRVQTYSYAVFRED
jgi:hypothetical protein